MIPEELMDGFTQTLKLGITALPVDGQVDSTNAWVYLANNGNELQRVSAFMVLLQAGVGFEVRLRTEASDGLVVNSSG